ncbi:transposable element Tcb2 transposase [Trichonephila clavipes]|uniref:Transposable element Tcb2 transposase n=1 Tax=Trichonephila clavipes TaxID=2585209 RepID=A0A8X6RTB5_TRICX|nr:transposable element Tcb2 transposase [Trichonephila clavipes]
MQRDYALRRAGRGCLTSFSVEYKTDNQRCEEVLGPMDPRDVLLHEDQAQDALDRPVVEKTATSKNCTRTANYFIGRYPDTGSIFARVLVSFRTIRRRLAEGHLGSLRPLRVLPLTPTHRSLRLEWCRARRNWTAAEWNQVVFSDESRFNISSDDNRIHVWRPHGERVNPAFVLQRHSWYGGMGCICLQYTFTPSIDPWHQRYVHDILPLMDWLPGAIFQEDNAPLHTARVSQECLCTVTTLPWPVRSPDVSPIERIWDPLE